MNDSIKNKLKELNTITKELQDTYQKEYLSGDFCERIAVLYTNKLMKWRKIELENHSMRLGVLYDKKDTKKDLCAKITEHYRNRLLVLQGIQIGINYVVNRLRALVEGPRCISNPEVFDMSKCRGHWAYKIVPPDKKLNQEFYAIYDKMESRASTDIDELLNIINDIKGMKNINTTKLEKYANDANNILDKLHDLINENYKLALITPTITQKEKQFKDLEKKEIEKIQDNAEKNQSAKEKARNHALRSSFNLQSPYKE